MAIKRPATVASFVSVIIFFLSNIFLNDIYLLLIIIVFIIVGLWSSDFTATQNDKDPSKVVIDEWVENVDYFTFLPNSFAGL